MPAPPVVDISTYTAPSPKGDDKFMRRSSWTKEQIEASTYATVPPPPVVVVDDYANFMRRASWNADQIKTVHAC